MPKSPTTHKAKKALANAGLVYIEVDVLCVELPNTPGALAKFTGKLAEKNINITMGYATGGEGSRKTTVVLAVSDLDKAAGIRVEAAASVGLFIFLFIFMLTPTPPRRRLRSNHPY